MSRQLAGINETKSRIYLIRAAGSYGVDHRLLLVAVGRRIRYCQTLGERTIRLNCACVICVSAIQDERRLSDLSHLTLTFATAGLQVPYTHRVIISDRKHVKSGRMKRQALNPAVMTVL